MKISDLEKIEDLYKMTVYQGDKEQYITFCSPECSKEIDAYLEFRKRRGEQLTGESHLLIKRFSKYLKNFKDQSFILQKRSPKSLTDTISLETVRFIWTVFISFVPATKADIVNPHSICTSK